MRLIEMLAAPFQRAVDQFFINIDNVANATAEKISLPDMYPEYLVTMGDGTKYSGNGPMWYSDPSKPGDVMVGRSLAQTLAWIVDQQLGSRKPSEGHDPGVRLN